MLDKTPCSPSLVHNKIWSAAATITSTEIDVFAAVPVYAIGAPLPPVPFAVPFANEPTLVACV